MPDLYRLTAEQLPELDGYGGDLGRRMRSRRSRRRRQRPFSRVLFGLNIPKVGWVTARNLARHFGTRRPARWTRRQEEIQEVDGHRARTGPS